MSQDNLEAPPRRSRLSAMLGSRPTRDHAVGFDKVREAETEWILDRRRTARQGRGKEDAELGDPVKDAIGLGFSGGGIRSATFNLGILQALERYGFLKSVDYLSTVSGGGYVGSAYTWFKSRQPGTFPFGTRLGDHAGVGGRVLSWLRGHGHYLTPGNGLNAWSLAVALITGTVINLLILVPVFLAAFFALSRTLLPVPDIVARFSVLSRLGVGRGDFFDWLLVVASAALYVLLVQILIYVFGSSIRVFRTFVWERGVRGRAGTSMMVMTLLIVSGTLPAVYALIAGRWEAWMQEIMSGISLTGVVGMVFGTRGRQGGNETKGWRSGSLSMGLALIVYGLFLWAFHVTHQAANVMPYVLAFAGSFVLALVANINHVSMHRYYRNRLMEAYMPYCVDQGHVATDDGHTCYPDAAPAEADRFFLKDIARKGNDAPYHIVNTAVNMVGSDNPKWRGRAADNFIFSPLYSGADATGWVSTLAYVDGTMNLATAFAISGAAVDPNTFATRSRPLAFLMTLFNVRLGYWIANPRKWMLFPVRPPWYTYMFREMLGKGLNERQSHVHLSDGGHFENLALYELVRRRCGLIIVSDAGADPEFSFSALAKVIEMVRLDFGAKIEIAVDDIKPRGKNGFSKRAYALGKITYPASGGEPETTANLVYIKTAMLRDLPEDINGYRRKESTFPDQTTADQFFDEPQFEAYRELGYHIGGRLCGWTERITTTDFLEGVNEQLKME